MTATVYRRCRVETSYLHISFPPPLIITIGQPLGFCKYLTIKRGIKAVGKTS